MPVYSESVVQTSFFGFTYRGVEKAERFQWDPAWLRDVASARNLDLESTHMHRTKPVDSQEMSSEGCDEEHDMIRSPNSQMIKSHELQTILVALAENL